MRDTIEMAHEAKLIYWMSTRTIGRWWMDAGEPGEELKTFEALVRADQDEKYKWDVHSCGPTCKRYACVAMREAVEAEREACAKVADGYIGCDPIAKAIRARGNT